MQYTYLFTKDWRYDEKIAEEIFPLSIQLPIPYYVIMIFQDQSIDHEKIIYIGSYHKNLICVCVLHHVY